MNRSDNDIQTIQWHKLRAAREPPVESVCFNSMQQDL